MVAAMAVLPTLVVIMAAGPMNQLGACLDRLLMFLGLSKAAYAGGAGRRGEGDFLGPEVPPARDLQVPDVDLGTRSGSNHRGSVGGPGQT